MATWLDRLLGEPALETVIVTLKTEVTIKGVLVNRGRDMLVLRAASKATLNQNRIEWAPMAGDVVVPIESLDYWQTGLEPAVLTEE